MKTQKFELVKFRDTEIVCPVEKEEIYVAIRQICKALGLDNGSQWRRIKKDAILGRFVVELTTEGKGGRFTNMTCIPLHFLNGWLFTIDETKAKPEARENLIAYKLECYKVLFNHFYEIPKMLEENARDEYGLLADNRKIDEEITKLSANLNQTNEAIKIQKLRTQKASNKTKITKLKQSKWKQLDLFEK